jgi:hypothetical protein
MNKEFLKMQKAAGLITESEYKEKMFEDQMKLEVYDTDLLGPEIMKAAEAYRKSTVNKMAIEKDAFIAGVLWSKK